MDDLVKTVSLMLVDLIDIAFRAPLWALLAWVIAAALTAAMISTVASSSGERVKVIIYIAVGLMVYIEILRPVGLFMVFG